MTFRVRVFLLVVLVALTAIGMTWFLTLSLAAREYERTQSAAERHRDDIVDELATYGLTHGEWTGVATLTAELAERTGLRIRLESASTDEVVVDTDHLAGRRARAVAPVPTTIEPRPPLDPRVGRQVRAGGGDRPRPPAASGLTAATLFTTPLTGLVPPGEAAPSAMTLKQVAQYRAALLARDCLGDGPEAALPLTESPYLSAGQLTTGGPCVESAARQVLEADGLIRERAAFEGCFRPGTADAATCLERELRTRLSSQGLDQLQLFLGGFESPGLRSLDRSAALGLAGLVVVAVAGTAAVARRVSRPVNRLTVASQRLADGDLDARVPTMGSDDLAQLSRSFNRMAEALQRSEERQRRLVEDVAHELRTPLSNLRGYLEGLQDGVVEPSRELFASLHEETLLQRRILDDLQVLALAEAGTLRYARAPVDLAELAAFSATVHRAVAAEANVVLTVEAPAEVWVEADPDRLRQVLGNLLTNAIRHTGAGGRVSVRAARDGAGAVLAVADTGAGIAAADLPRVFDRFWRADRTRQRATGGSGLGLTIAHRIVTDHGGRIEVASVVGDGTTFTVRLAAARPPASSRH